MSGNKLFVDTNIIIYLLSGDNTIADLLDGKVLHISFITQLELLGYREINSEEENRIKDFLDQCVVIDVNTEIKKQVVRIRKTYKLKLPDCIIIATAIFLDLPFISADKSLKNVEELNMLYYENQ